VHAVKNFSFRNPALQMTDIFKVKNQDLMMTQNGSLKHIGRLPSGYLKLKFLTTMHIQDMFCII